MAAGRIGRLALPHTSWSLREVRFCSAPPQPSRSHFDTQVLQSRGSPVISEMYPRNAVWGEAVWGREQEQGRPVAGVAIPACIVKPWLVAGSAVGRSAGRATVTKYSSPARPKFILPPQTPLAIRRGPESRFPARQSPKLFQTSPRASGWQFQDSRSGSSPLDAFSRQWNLPADRSRRIPRRCSCRSI